MSGVFGPAAALGRVLADDERLRKTKNPREARVGPDSTASKTKTSPAMEVRAAKYRIFDGVISYCEIEARIFVVLLGYCRVFVDNRRRLL
jgi:hypothetical protein